MDVAVLRNHDLNFKKLSLELHSSIFRTQKTEHIYHHNSYVPEIKISLDMLLVTSIL